MWKTDGRVSIGGAGDVASPFDKTVLDKTSCFATGSSPLSLPLFSKNIQPFVNSFQIPLKYDKKAGKQIFEQVSGVLVTFTWLEA